MKRIVFIAMLMLAAATAACEGPRGKSGGVGTDGPDGPAGLPGPRLSWVDAAGAVVPNLFSSSTGEVFLNDASGNFWKVDPETLVVSGAAADIGAFYFESVNCVGTPHIVGTPPLPRLVAHSLAATPPFNTDYFVRADGGGAVASLAPFSFDNGSGCTVIGGAPTPATAMISVGATPPAITGTAPLHPVLQ